MKIDIDMKHVMKIDNDIEKNVMQIDNDMDKCHEH